MMVMTSLNDQDPKQNPPKKPETISEAFYELEQALKEVIEPPIIALLDAITKVFRL